MFVLKDKSGVDKIIVKRQPYQLLNTNRELFLKDKSGVDKIIVKRRPYQLLNTNRELFLKDKSGVDKIIVKRQPYQLLNTNREFFPSSYTSNFHKLVDQFSQDTPNIVAILYCVRMSEGAIRRLAM